MIGPAAKTAGEGLMAAPPTSRLQAGPGTRASGLRRRVPGHCAELLRLLRDTVIPLSLRDRARRLHQWGARQTCEAPVLSEPGPGAGVRAGLSRADNRLKNEWSRRESNPRPLECHSAFPPPVGYARLGVGGEPHPPGVVSSRDALSSDEPAEKPQIDGRHADALL